MKHLRAAPRTQKPVGAEINRTGAFWFLGVAVGGGESDMLAASLHPGTPSPVRFFANRCEGCLPLFVSDMLASPGAFYRPPDGTERAPGHRLRINETSNYIQLLQGVVPRNDPHVSEFSHLLRVPLENIANYKKIILKKDKWKRPQKKITKRCHLSTPGSGPRTPLWKPASLSL